jgi:hypothetical protein
MQHSRMSCSAFRDRASHRGLGPMRSLKVEDYEVRKVGSMFILATEDQKLVLLVEGGSMTY